MSQSSDRTLGHGSTECRCDFDGRMKDVWGMPIQLPNLDVVCHRAMTQEDLLCDTCRTGTCTNVFVWLRGKWDRVYNGHVIMADVDEDVTQGSWLLV